MMTTKTTGLFQGHNKNQREINLFLIIHYLNKIKVCRVVGGWWVYLYRITTGTPLVTEGMLQRTSHTGMTTFASPASSFLADHILF